MALRSLTQLSHQPWGQEQPFLDVTAVAAGLGSCACDYWLCQQEQLDSTQQALKVWAPQELPSGFCLVAQRQTAGQGRQGRPWLSDPMGSLTFSLWWITPRRPHQLSALGLLASLALARALARCGVTDVTLKWPNDVRRQGAKLGGVMADLVPLPAGETGVILGIGLNLKIREDLRIQIDQPIADLAVRGGVVERALLLGTILAAWADLMLGVSEPLLAGLEAEWLARCDHHRQPVTLHFPDGTQVQGLSHGLATTGELLLQLADGQIQRYHGGEISLRGWR